MPSYKFARLAQDDAEYLQGLELMSGLEGELSSNGLKYNFKDGEGNFATFTLDPETKEITVEYDPEGDNEISEQEEAIRGVLEVTSTGGGRRRRKQRKTAKKSRRVRRRRHTARRVR